MNTNLTLKGSNDTALTPLRVLGDHWCSLSSPASLDHVNELLCVAVFASCTVEHLITHVLKTQSLEIM